MAMKLQKLKKKQNEKNQFSQYKTIHFILFLRGKKIKFQGYHMHIHNTHTQKKFIEVHCYNLISRWWWSFFFLKNSIKSIIIIIMKMNGHNDEFFFGKENKNEKKKKKKFQIQNRFESIMIMDDKKKRCFSLFTNSQ